MALGTVPVVHGYYRYTDIQFEWGKVLQDEDELQKLKAFLSMHAVASPEHPFWEGKDKGAVMYKGTLPHGQARLLLSSKQVEYARYWIHAMGLSKNMIPIPSSDNLIERKDLRHITAVYYKTIEELKNAIKEVDKSNRALKGADSALLYYRQNFEKVRALYGSRKGTWLSIDIEAWEREHTMITEFGWCKLTWGENASGGGNSEDGEKIEDGHIIVSENTGVSNHFYMPEAAGMRERYCFGTSERIPGRAMKETIKTMLNDAQEQGPVFLIFHDPSQDVKCLLNHNNLYSKYFGDLPLDGLAYALPSETPSKGLFIIDTQELFAGLEGSSSGDKRNLQTMCRLLKIETKMLHNAGNDAHFTLLALMSMASGNQVDRQREDRWPKQTTTSSELGSTFKVEHNPWEEDSDFSDLEGAADRIIDPETRDSLDRQTKVADEDNLWR